ncbi:MAG: carbohydrate binding domain-containing protein, partial [Rariglobus sp.]
IGRLKNGLLFSLFTLAGFAHAQVAGVDIPGPDGLYYPDFRQAGVPGGIPNVTNVLATITSGQATSDLAGAIESAVASATVPGVIALPSGTYSLTRPVLIGKDGIVLRGAGNGVGGTFLNFTYQAPAGTIAFYQPDAAASSLYNNTWVEFHADPVGLVGIDILAGAPGTPNASLTKVDGVDVKSSNGGWGSTFSRACIGSKVRGVVGTGSKIVVGCAKYGTWDPVTKVMTVTSTIYTTARTYNIVNSTDANAFPRPNYLAAINFVGKGELTTSGTRITASAVRGATTLQMTSSSGFATGDPIVLSAPRNAIWDAQVGNLCTSNIFRYYQYKITGISGTTITLNQPLRIDYPIEGTNPAPFIKKLGVLQNCGVEDLVLTQTNNLWTCGIQFSYAWKSWIQNVTVNKAGRHPVYLTDAKWCQIEDSTFNDAWAHGGGGTAYCGFEMAFDCLMDNVVTTKLRHGPLVQNSAAGNVIRNSTFIDSEAHWHAGWTNENLFENNTIIANLGNGSYGNGLFSSAPNDVQHGPNGPRNVVYNCDISSPELGTWLGGSNKDWIFVHNRFAVDSGELFYAKAGSSGHVFHNNIAVLQSSASAINLSDTASTGSDFTDSDFDGVFNPSTAFLAGSSSAFLAGNIATDHLIPQAFANSGFESGNLTGWVNTGDGGMSVVVTTSPHLGSNCLKVTDSSTTAGSSLYSAYLPVSPGHVYATRFFYTNTGKGMSVYLRFYNSSYVLLSGAQTDVAEASTWQPDMVQYAAPVGAAYARIYVHSYSGATSVSQFDDFEFGEVGYLAFSALAFDAGFEGGQWVGWDATGDSGQSTIIANALTSFATNHVLKVLSTGSGGTSSLASQQFNAMPGDTYQIRCDAKTLSGSGIGIDLNFYDASSALLASQTLDLPSEPSLYPAENVTPPPDGAMKQFTLRAVAPAGTAKANIRIHSYTGAAVEAHLDNIVVLDLPPRPAPSVPSIFDWQRNPAFPQPNAGFESGNITGWSNAGDNGMSAVSTSAAHTGTCGVRVIDNSTTLSSSLQSQTFLVLPGVSYTVSFWDRVISGSGIGVYLVFLDANQNSISGTNLVNLQPTDTSWTQRSGTFVAPANAAYAYVRIHSFSANIVTADLDDLKFSTVLP